LSDLNASAVSALFLSASYYFILIFLIIGGKGGLPKAAGPVSKGSAMSYLEFLTSETPDKVSPRALSNIRLVTFNIASVDNADLSTAMINEVAQRLQGRFHVIILQVFSFPCKVQSATPNTVDFLGSLERVSCPIIG
jgi:hypothetical protein